VAELASAARAVGTGLQVLQAMLEEDVARLVGPEGRHNPDRVTVRHGSRGFSDTDALRCGALRHGIRGAEHASPMASSSPTTPTVRVKEGTREENYALADRGALPRRAGFVRHQGRGYFP
jgi:hypothetical protein